MRTLVTGDRKWDDAEMVYNALLRYGASVVIEGEARGADLLAREAAEWLGLPVEPFPADWNKYGRAAGPIRNTQMLDEGEPEQVLAFHDDLANSKGTLNMVTQARRRGLPVILLFHPGTPSSRYVFD